MKAKAYIHPNFVYRTGPPKLYTFSTYCPMCPQWPWPVEQHEAFVVHTCYESEYPENPCRFFQYMEVDRDEVWIHCASPKWNKGKHP
jgi:hypothetical protein